MRCLRSTMFHVISPRVSYVVGFIVVVLCAQAQAQLWQAPSAAQQPQQRYVDQLWANETYDDAGYAFASSEPLAPELAPWSPAAATAWEPPVVEGVAPPASEEQFEPWDPWSEVAGDCDGELCFDPLLPTGQPWQWQLLPAGLIWRSYLAGDKEPRMGLTHIEVLDPASYWGGTFWDSTIGGRVSLIRYGSHGGPRPEGIELQIEGAAFPRLDLDDERDVTAVDFRVGLPLVYAYGHNEYKLAYYHLSAHLGDEFMLKNPDYRRINYSRDVIVLGYAYRPDVEWRLYGEVGYAVVYDGGTEPWEVQFGAEYSTLMPTGWRGSPFAAVNAHMHQEVNYNARLTVQAGWQWRGDGVGRLFRLGVHYLNGLSPQYELLPEHEQQIGGGIWYDF